MSAIPCGTRADTWQHGEGSWALDGTPCQVDDGGHGREDQSDINCKSCCNRKARDCDVCNMKYLAGLEPEPVRWRKFKPERKKTPEAAKNKRETFATVLLRHTFSKSASLSSLPCLFSNSLQRRPTPCCSIGPRDGAALLFFSSKL